MAYQNYVKKKTPVHNLPTNMAKAFVTGGLICVAGQGILNYCKPWEGFGHQWKLDIADTGTCQRVLNWLGILSGSGQMGRAPERWCP